jgi:Ner family transcriptional regulator
MRTKQDWHRADVKCALEKAGTSLAQISRQLGLHARSASEALRNRWPSVERAIADVLQVHPSEIWPSRYDAQGNPIQLKRGRKPTAPATVRASRSKKVA